MKRIDALIQPAAWDQIHDVLETLRLAVTLREVKTFGRGSPRREVYRGTAYYTEFTLQLELTALVEDDRLESTLAALEAVLESSELLVSAVEAVLHRARPTRAAQAPVPVRAKVVLGVAQPRHA